MRMKDVMNDDNSQLTASERIQDLFTGIAKLITSSLEINRVTSAIMQQVELFYQPHNWSLLRVDEETQELYFVIAKGIDIKKIKHIRLKCGEGIAGHVMESKQSILIQNAQTDPRFSKKVDNASGFVTQSLIAVPIIFQQQILGVIEIINALEERNFSKQDLEILEAIADFSAIAFSNAIAFDRIVWAATHDPLTGLYNRSFLNHLENIKNQHGVSPSTEQTEQNHYMIAILVDVNKFKEVNDQYGHRTGDDILVETAHLLQSLCGKNDFAFRIGGDEFLVLIRNLEKDAVVSKMEALEKELIAASTKIPPASGLAFGMAVGIESNLEALIKEADDLMYLHKTAEDVMVRE